MLEWKLQYWTNTDKRIKKHRLRAWLAAMPLFIEKNIILIMKD